MNNAFTHALAQFLRMTGGMVRAVTGKVTRGVGLIPVGEPVHDFRELWKETKTEEVLEWKEADADMAFLAMVEIEMPAGNTACVLFQGSGKSFGKYDAYVGFYGSKGTLRINIGDANKIVVASAEQPEWKEMPVPQEYIDRLPAVEDRVQRDWNQLFREFSADIRGEGNAGYLTFYDGWVANEVIDAIRSGEGWVKIPDEPR